MKHKIYQFSAWYSNSLLTLMIGVLCMGTFCSNAQVGNITVPITSGGTGVNAIEYDNSYVYIGGSFTLVSKNSNLVAKVSTTSDVYDACLPQVRAPFTGAVYAIVADGSGGWYIGGDFTSINGTTRNNLAHLLSTGALDANFNPNVNSIVYCMALSGGNLYIGGSFTNVGGFSRTYLARIVTSTGFVDNTWNPSLDGNVLTMALDGTSLYVGGAFNTAGGSSRNRIAKFNTTNTTVDTWNPSTTQNVNALVVDASYVYIGGQFTTIGGQSRNYLARSNKTTGAIDVTWNPNMNGFVYALAMDGTALYAGGAFTTVAGGTARGRLAKYSLTDGSLNSWNPNASGGNVLGLASDGSNVYAIGAFTSVGGQSQNYVAKIDNSTGSLVTSWNPYPNASGNCITVNGTDVMLGGTFTGINSKPRNNLARFNINTNQIDENWNPNANSLVRDIVINGNDIYVGGDFTTVGGQSRNSLAKLNNVNGNADASWNPNVTGGLVRTLLIDGTDMYIGGIFTNVTASARDGLAKLTLSSGALSSWNPNGPGNVNTLLINGSDLYVGGSFSSANIGGVTRSYIARVDKNTAVGSAWNANADNVVEKLFLNGSFIYVAGNFTSIGGAASCKNIARFNSSTGVIDNTWTPNNAGSDGYITALLVDGTDVYVGGPFSTMAGTARLGIARFNTTGNTLDATWNPGNSSSFTNDIKKINGDLYMGGQFATMGGYVSPQLARIGTRAGVTKTWLGISNTNWATACNWYPNGVPVSTDVVTVPAGTTYSPDLFNGTFAANTLYLDAGVTLSSNTGTLTLSAGFVNNATVTAATSTSGQIILGGTSAQQISGIGVIANLNLNNSNGATIASGSTTVTGTLSITSGTLTTNGLLTIRSDASGTGRIAQLTGTPISGNVTIERYIPAKAARKWSFLACPVNGNTIRNGWQDDIFITGAGTGTYVCGDGSAGSWYNSNGFDHTITRAPSMWTYNSVQVNGSRWVSVPNTTATNLTPGTGYRLNVRGSRGINNINCANQLYNANPPGPAATTLSVTGTIRQGSVTVPVFGRTAYNASGGSGNAYTLIGNPYASEVSLQAFYTTNSSIITSSFWFYTPLNVYNLYSTYNAATQQALDFPTGYTNGNVSNVIIASGQAFMVERNSSTNTNVTFNEAHKSTTATNGNAFYRSSSIITDKVKISLGDVSNSDMSSSVYINFLNDIQASNTDIGMLDSYSFNTENTFYLASLKDSNVLAIQTKSAFSGNDTVNIVFKANTGNYKLGFSEYDQFITATEIKLIDNFTGTITDVRQNPEYSFSVTSDNNSYGSSRFRVVFRSATLPISGIALNGTSRQEGVQLNWTVLTETDMNGYVAERSSDGRTFTAIGQVKATGNNNSNHNYTYLDTKPLSNTSYYRIRAIGNNGEIKYSSIIKIQQGKTWSIQLYPNPVKDQLYITMTNTGSDEVYTFRIINAYGQEVLRSNGKALSGKLSVNVSTLTQGIYQLQVFNKAGEVITEKFIRR